MVFSGFMFCCGLVYILITTLVGIFKRENSNRLNEYHYEKINIYQNYKLVWNVLKLSRMRIFIFILLTSSVNIFRRLYRLYSQYLKFKFIVIVMLRFILHNMLKTIFTIKIYGHIYNTNHLNYHIEIIRVYHVLLF